MTSILTSVASAAVIGGDLIIGLSDGSLINCGRVQGPVGLTGPEGPMGASGRDGQPGNTIHTVQGAPDGSLGRDGDYAINVAVWEIYGPRAGGVWGSGTPLRGNVRGGQSPETTQNLFGSNSSSSGGSGGGIKQIQGGDGISATKQNDSVYLVDADIDSAKGLAIDGGKIAISIGDGLEFDANTGALKATGGGGGDLSEYAKKTYVDQQDNALGSRIDGCATNAALQTESSARDTGDKVNLGLIEANKGDIEELDVRVTSNTQAIAAIPPAPDLDSYAKKSDLATATAALPYTIETDKTLRQVDFQHPEGYDADVRYAGGEIYLTDNLGFYSNVRFTGTNNITTSSDAQGIIVDGANLMPKNLLSLPELT